MPAKVIEKSTDALMVEASKKEAMIAPYFALIFVRIASTFMLCVPAYANLPLPQ